MNQAYTDAFNALALEDTSLRDLNKINSASKKALNRSDLDSASKLADDAKNLLNMNK